MTEAELMAWFDDIQRELPQPQREWHLVPKFVADAESAISAAFPRDHALMRLWGRTRQDLMAMRDTFDQLDRVRQLIGIFESAHHQLDARRRGSFTSIARTAAETDLLGVASELLDANFRAAAAVTAGGALEVHLRGLCERQGIAWDGKGQIENYKAALERAYKADPSAGISTTDAKLVNGWGGLRNDAAHRPDDFAKGRSDEEVRLMIGGIREFVARTT